MDAKSESGIKSLWPKMPCEEIRKTNYTFDKILGNFNSDVGIVNYSANFDVDPRSRTA